MIERMRLVREENERSKEPADGNKESKENRRGDAIADAVEVDRHVVTTFGEYSMRRRTMVEEGRQLVLGR